MLRVQEKELPQMFCVKREGIEPPTFRSGVERATIAPPLHRTDTQCITYQKFIHSLIFSKDSLPLQVVLSSGGAGLTQRFGRFGETLVLETRDFEFLTAKRRHHLRESTKTSENH